MNYLEFKNVGLKPRNYKSMLLSVNLVKANEVVEVDRNVGGDVCESDSAFIVLFKNLGRELT